MLTKRQGSLFAVNQALHRCLHYAPVTVNDRVDVEEPLILTMYTLAVEDIGIGLPLLRTVTPEDRFENVSGFDAL